MSKDINVDIENKRNNKLSLEGFEVIPLLDNQHVISETYKLNQDRDFDTASGVELFFFYLFGLSYRVEKV
ncbi:hypothetical protein [Priestia filamentosa]|uniref:hypothetical protein n=1 Tax=Priestia filamentosa TaxID=1402861 RepID=UPI000A0887CF|nr:hypothetical protein [Priestia filamentosa]MDT3762960.1 hypothetical protein [Priestia filamentosa]OXS69482.1 hypothetical protein B1B01_10970 [Priestia filamentosa]WRU97401.1 hypothetical protein RYX51_10125 [Priestia filamentosa]SMF33107.1 hypothetical protein SAMN06296056_102766 [Priestia filamentosa]